VRRLLLGFILLVGFGSYVVQTGRGEVVGGRLVGALTIGAFVLVEIPSLLNRVRARRARRTYRPAAGSDEELTWYRLDLSHSERTLGARHPNTLTARSNLARAYESAGRLDEAIPLFEQTLADRQKTTGGQDPGTLISLNNLALAYQSAGRLDEAIALLEQALAVCARSLEPAHPIMEAVQGNLAAARQAKGVEMGHTPTPRSSPPAPTASE
jgi:tetratricopeptide (TPR) repeat protein